MRKPRFEIVAAFSDFKGGGALEIRETDIFTQNKVHIENYRPETRRQVFLMLIPHVSRTVRPESLFELEFLVFGHVL